MPREKCKGVGRIVAGVVNPPLLDTVDKLHGIGYSDSEIVRQGIRLLARREKVAA
jgi:hypothetical protein